MRTEHIKGWLEEAQKVEVTAVKVAEEATEATGGTGEEDTEAEREMDTKKELTNWEKVVSLARVDFGEGAAYRRIHVAGGGPDPQGERGLLRYRPHGDGVEGSGGVS